MVNSLSDIVFYNPIALSFNMQPVCGRDVSGRTIPQFVYMYSLLLGLIDTAQASWFFLGVYCRRRRQPYIGRYMCSLEKTLGPVPILQ